MATYKYREEIVGKRFLSVSSQSKLKYSKINEWSWRSGFVRAVSHKDYNHPDLTILVEFDDTDWKSRDWIRLYLDDPFAIFLVENTLVWTPRSDASCARNFYWPSLSFKPLVENTAFAETSLQPVEFLVDQELGFVDYGDLVYYQEKDDEYPPPFREFSEVQKAIKQWNEYQDGQRILVSTPSILVGYRVEVYRVEGTTQWYTAVIISYNDNTRELTLTDDTVLEEHNEDPCLVQMKLIGEGVVESILKGESTGITPRRRSNAKEQQHLQQLPAFPPVHYCTRTRSHPPLFFNASLRLNCLPPRRARHRVLTASATKTSPDAIEESPNDSTPSTSAAAPSTTTPPAKTASSVPAKVSTEAASHSHKHHDVGGRRKKTSSTAHAAVGHRRDRRRKNKRHKRASSSKGSATAVSASAKTIVCHSKRPKLSARFESKAAGKEKKRKAKEKSLFKLNGLDGPSVSLGKSGVAPKLLLSVKSVKESSAKHGNKNSKQRKLASNYGDIHSSSTLEWTVSAVSCSRQVSATIVKEEDADKLDNIDDYDIASNSSVNKSFPNATLLSSGISVVLAQASFTTKVETKRANESDAFSAEVVNIEVADDSITIEEIVNDKLTIDEVINDNLTTEVTNVTIRDGYNITEEVVDCLTKDSIHSPTEDIDNIIEEGFNDNRTEELVDDNLTEVVDNLTEEVVIDNFGEVVVDNFEETVDDNLTEEVVDNLTEGVVDNLTEGVVGDNLTEGVVGDNLTEGVVGDNLTEGVVGDNLTEGVVDDNLTEGVVDDNLTEGVVDDNLTEGVVDDNLTEGVVDDNLTEGVVDDNLTEGVVDDNLTEGVVDDNLTEGVVDDNLTEGVVDDNLTEGVVDDNLTEEVDDNLTEEVVDDNLTEELLDDKSAEKIVNDKSVENIVDNKPVEIVVDDKLFGKVVDDNLFKEAVETSNVCESAISVEESRRQKYKINSQSYKSEKNTESKFLLSFKSETQDYSNVSKRLPSDDLAAPRIVIKRLSDSPIISENSPESSITCRSLPESPVANGITLDLSVRSKSQPVSPVPRNNLPESLEVKNSFQDSLAACQSLPNSPVVCGTSSEHIVIRSSLKPADLVVKLAPEHLIVDRFIPQPLVVNVNTQETSVVSQNKFESYGVSTCVPKQSVDNKNTLATSNSSPNSPAGNQILPNLPIVSKSLPNSPKLPEIFVESTAVVSKSSRDSSVVRIHLPESSAANKYLPNSSAVNKRSLDDVDTGETAGPSFEQSEESWAESETVNKKLLLSTDVKQSLSQLSEQVSQPFDLRSVLKSSPVQELCPREIAVSCANTEIRAEIPHNFPDYSSKYSRGVTSCDIKENISASGSSRSNSSFETFPQAFDLSSNVKQEFPIPVNGTHEGGYDDTPLIYDSSHIKRETEYETVSKHSCDGFVRPLPESHSLLKWKQEGRISNSCNSSQNLFGERKYQERNVIVNATQHKHSSYKNTSSTFGQSQGNAKNFGTIPCIDSSHASSNAKNGDPFFGARGSGMSHLDRIERGIEKSSSSLQSGGASTANHKLQHVVNDHRALSLRTPPESSVSKERSRSEERRRNAGHLQVDRHETVRVYRDPILVNNGSGVRHVDCLHPGLMHPAGITHSAAAAAAAAVYPRVAALPQHTRNSSAPIPPSPLGPYSLSSHLIPPPHVSGAPAAAGAPPGSHIEQQHAAAMHSQAYRHLLSQHPLMPPQYGSSTGPHVGLDLMWQQKYPSPWMMAQYEEGLRLERERAMAQERERSRMERDRRDDIERADREKVEREKIEKERLERERMQKEQQRQDRERIDRERLDREERERVQREAVQQHFEESLRHMQKQPHHQKSVGWSPMSSLSLGKTQSGIGRSSPTVSQSLHPSDHDRDKVREKEKERMSAMEARIRHDHERWLAAVQRNDQAVAHSSPHAPNYSSVEPRSGSSQAKPEMYSMSRVSPHAATTVGHHSSKPGIVPSPVVSSPTVTGVPASQQKSETSFSLYGYQPFQHTYITQAQLKAREETKGSNNMQPVVVPGNKQPAPNVATKDKEAMYERPSTPGRNRTSTPIGPGSSTKQQLKLVHQSHERASPMYQPPLVGSGGAFKPYEYSNSSPAPPAHQNSSSPTIATRINTPHFLHSQQEQPQNLVKGDNKGSYDQPSGSIPNSQRYESRDVRQTLSTPPTSVPSSYTPPYSHPKSTSPASSTNYSYNLIQQGLVPNPLYMASTHGGSSPALNISATTSGNQQSKSSCANSPPISQQFPRAATGAGITSGTPVCRSSNLSYPGSQSKGNPSYSPVGHIANQAIAINPNRSGPQEAHAVNRLHAQSTGSNHRSPSPAHIYGSVPPLSMHTGTLNSTHHSSSSPRLNTSISSSQVQALHRMSVHSNTNAITTSPTQSALSDNQALPLNLQGNSPVGKRKSVKDINHKKRQKTNEDHLLPPQLHPQIVHPTGETTTTQQVGTPPNIVSNSCLSSVVPYLGGSILPSPNTPEGSPNHLPTKPESSTAVTPELHYTSAASGGNSNVAAFIDSYRSFVNTPQENSSFSGKPKVPNKPSAAENLALDTIEPPVRPASTTNSTVSNFQAIPAIIVSQDGCDESRMTISPASSASSTLTSSSGTGGSVNHTKLKKAWLQRHSENEDKKTPPEPLKIDSPTKVTEAEDQKEIIQEVPSKSALNVVGDEQQTLTVKIEAVAINGPGEKSSKLDGQQEDSTSSASETEDVKFVKRKLRISRKQGCPSPTVKKQKINSGPAETPVEESQPLKKEKESNKKKNLAVEKEASLSSKRRGRKTKGKNTASEDESKKKPPKPVEKPSVAQLKKTGEAFLQDGPCCEVAPRLPKCRECRMTPHQRSKKMPNIFCRFYAFRKLRYGKNGTILGAGFSELSDATDDDLKLWLPPIESPPSDIEVETSKFLLTHVGDQFCDLVEMEREAQALHMSETTITWKRVVQGVREMCDVCETTLFNIHWVCHKCGFVVCIDCYKTRKNGFGKGEDSVTKDRDEFQWLLCANRQPHEQDKLMITQIISSTALWDVGKTLHDIRRKWNIPTYCNCSFARDGDQDGKHSTNGICKLMSAVTKCFSSEKESSQVNGLSESSRLSKKSKGSSVNGVKQDDGISGYSSESGGSPLSWLADVALNSTSKGKGEKNRNNTEDGDDDKLSDNQSEHADGFAESDDEKSENFSTLRELLIRPMGKMGGKHGGTDSSSQKTLTSTLDEVISCVIEQRVRKPDGNCKEKQLLHFTRKHQTLRSGRELLPIRSCTITESSLLYPETPHFWLGTGKILLLTDPYHSGNMQMFQEQWKRGQPVIVADVGQNLDESLWSPDSFIRDFGDVKNDFLNCLCGTLVQNQPMKRFWEGFENLNKRMKDEDGKSMILKLKDWPPSEEFSELLPARYQDLMKVLPLPHYTNRDGMFNMASRLPDCFVRPDLGPRMYNAYGLAPLCNKGSTNLHLDISDSLNILVYASDSSEEEEEDSTSKLDISRVIEESGCDSLMKKRSLENSSKIGAIWHIYNARDADKIRDLLNKVAEEQGANCDPHHDPIHNQEWYLDAELRERLLKEYNVKGYVIVQNVGDAIFIPAGSPHQVRNIKSCIKISEDFISPESVAHSFFLTQEIRNLPDGPINHEDKLQIKNIIYHAVKDALALLQSCDPEDSKS